MIADPAPQPQMPDFRPDVSVIVPVFNRVQVMHRSILSILSQRDVMVELIVVDDCSTDDSWAQLQAIRDSNPAHAIVLHRLYRNSAQATARNRGLELARGQFVAFLDTDDALADTMILADMVRRARADRLDMLVAPFVYFDGASMTEVSRLDLPRPVVTARDWPQVVNMRSHWHALYTREFLDRVPLRFAENIRHREDRPFVVEALLKVDRLGAFDRPMVHYFRDMADSVMNNPTLREFGFYLEHLREVNGSMDRARVENRLHPEFERLNAALYACSHLHYWRAAWLELMIARTPEMMALADDFDLELARLFHHTGPLHTLDAAFPDESIVLDADSDLVSGRADLLRLAFLRCDRDLARVLLTEDSVPLSALYGLRGKGDDAEQIAQLALAFSGQREGRAGRAGVGRPGEQVPRVLLHVGGTKTGSSALQNYLEANRFRLLEQGFLYPATGTTRESGVRSNRNAGHDALIWGLLHPDLAERMQTDLATEIAALPHPPHTLLLSLETILSPRFAQAGTTFAQIAEALGGKLEVFWLEREAEDWLRSIHRELTCNPRNGFLASLADVRAQYAAHGLLDGAHVRQMLTAPPNVAALHGARYEEVRDTGGTIDWFCRLAGIDTRGFRAVTDAQYNRSLTDDQMGLIARLKAEEGLTSAIPDSALWLAASSTTKANYLSC